MALKFLMSQLDGNWKGGLRESILLLVQAHMEAIISPFKVGLLLLPLRSPQMEQHLPWEGQNSTLQEAHLSEPKGPGQTLFWLYFSGSLKALTPRVCGTDGLGCGFIC